MSCTGLGILTFFWKANSPPPATDLKGTRQPICEQGKRWGQNQPGRTFGVNSDHQRRRPTSWRGGGGWGCARKRRSRNPQRFPTECPNFRCGYGQPGPGRRGDPAQTAFAPPVPGLPRQRTGVLKQTSLNNIPPRLRQP